MRENKVLIKISIINLPKALYSMIKHQEHIRTKAEALPTLYGVPSPTHLKNSKNQKEKKGVAYIKQ